MPRHIVIVGNGVAGVTTARFLRKHDPDVDITIVSSESRYHFSRTALMYVYMGHLSENDIKPYDDGFWERNRFSLRQDLATRVNAEERSLELATGEQLAFDALVLATGSRPNRLGWEGENLRGVQGLVSIQDLHAMEAATRDIDRAVVVGGGLIGIEMAEMLRSRGIAVTFLVRETGYMDYLLAPSESKLIHHQIHEHGVDLRLGTELAAILGDDSGSVRSIRTSNGEEIACQFVGLSVGVSANVELAKSSGIECGRGILVDRQFRTGKDGIYAVGDCAEFREPLQDGRTIEQLWYSGRHQGRDLGLILSGKQHAYSEPIFFNSAKFFDLEFQTYGRISNDPSTSISCGDGRRKVRVEVEEDSRKVLGVNAFGVRLRHEFIATAIRYGMKVDSFLERWTEACFDPEFSRSLEPPSGDMIQGVRPAKKVPV